MTKSYTGTGTGEWQGDHFTTGNSGAYRYINISSAVFNASTGITAVTYTIGTYVDYGNFYGSTFTSWGSSTDTYTVNGVGTYDVVPGTYNCPYNGQINFLEGCGFNSYSVGWLESEVKLTWKPTLPTYTVSYNANGGSGAPPSQTKKWGSSLTLSNVKPTRTGYTFRGWATTQARANAGTVDYASGASYNSNANQTLWAVWQIVQYTITYKPNGASGSDITQTKDYGATATLASSGFTRANYTLSKWNTSANGGGTDYALGASYSTNANLTLYAIWLMNTPESPTSFDVTRVSDVRTELAWGRPSTADATWQKVYVYRSTDGGAYEEIANVAGTATSYADETTAANHYYKYRIRAYNAGGSGQFSPYATQAGYVYNTPAAPSSATAARIDASGTGVIVYLSNPAITADGFEVECSADGESWTSGGITIDSSVGTPVTEIDLTMTSGGSYYYRIRNTRTSPSLASAWTVTNLVVTIVPPNPPTLVSPSSGSVVAYGSASGTTVDFQWTHNPIDGSPQSAAQLRYSVDGGATWVSTVQLTTAQTYRLTYAFALNATVTWQVRTKGVADDYGDWASSSTFAIYQAPSISITAPTTTIIGVPINYALSYTDTSGQFASGTVSVIHGNQVVYSEPLIAPSGGVIDGSIFASEFLPEDGETYTFKFDVASNTTLTKSAQATLSVDMEAPYIGTVVATNDPDTGYVSVMFGWDAEAGGQPVASATLYRISNGVRKELATTTTNPASCLDMYAPLNTDYTYLVVTIGENEAVNQFEKANRLDTGFWFAYYGDGKIAKAKWNPNGSRKVSRPERTRVHYIGRKDPVSYDGTAVDDESSIEWRIIDREYALAFLDMVREIGRGVYKSGVGEVYHADFDSASVASDFHKNQPYGTLSLPIVRIDGDAL